MPRPYKPARPAFSSDGSDTFAADLLNLDRAFNKALSDSEQDGQERRLYVKIKVGRIYTELLIVETKAT